MRQEPKKEDKSKITAMLVERVKSGDIEAFVELVRIYKQEILAYCYTTLRKYGQEAEVVAEDVFVKAFDKIGQQRENASFRSWLYSIAYHECIDTIKRLNRKNGKGEKVFIPDPVDELDIRDLSPSPGEVIISNEREQRIKYLATVAEGIIDGLDSKYKDIFNLIHYQELTYKEAAEILNIPENTAKTHMRRALDSIRKKLKSYKDLYGDELF